MPKVQRTNAQELLSFMSEYGRAYLQSGGPTSRLEEALSSLGRKFDHPSEVFATPTGIFTSCIDETGHTHTSLSRIKETGMNLGRLCWLENIFEDVYSRKITIAQANKILNSKVVQKSPYPFWQNVLAALVLGFSLSFSAFQSFTAAVASGLISMATWWISGPGLKSQISSSIFRDFVGCTVTLGLAALFQMLRPAPFEAYTIGGIIVLVPGLALTTAIAELADQNLVSGTAKLMQAILTLLALGLAYMLFQELSASMGLMPAPSSGPRPVSILAGMAGVLVAVTCFGVLFKVPMKSLPWAALTGVLGWLVLRSFSATPYYVSASYLASFTVGTVSLWIANRYKVPSQLFSVPGILAMLPGMLALNSMRSFALGHDASGLDLGVRVILTAGSIVFGLFTARIPFALQFNPFKRMFRAAQGSNE
ncbi:MAG: threonine/serine exporter family protein [Bdellovibrionota bacterium]